MKTKCLLKREARAKEMLKLHLTNLARTVTLVKKWEKRVRYYEQTIRRAIVQDNKPSKKRAIFLHEEEF